MRYLLLIDAAGDVVLGDADSGARISVDTTTRPAGHRARATTAVWSPAGRWTAWSIDSDASSGFPQSRLPESPVHEIRVHDEATNVTEVLAESLTAFYLCPSPCGRYLSHLSPGPLGLELAVSEIGTGDVRIVERGQPLFWAWSPEGDRIAVHVEDRVVVASLDGGEPLVVTERAGPFTAPWWLPGGSVVLIVDGRIVSAVPDGSLTTLVERAGAGRFAVDSDGRRIALIELVDDRPRLVVVDLLTGETELTIDRPTAAFFWSPDGRRLAALVPASATELQWLVLDGSETLPLAPFRPGRTWLATVLPFFEQYSRSHPVWSADSRELVAPALDADGALVALIQSVEPPYRVDRLADAELVWWAAGD